MTRFVDGGNGKSRATLNQLYSKTIQIGEIFHNIDFSIARGQIVPYKMTRMFSVPARELFEYGVRFFFFFMKC